MKDETYYFGEVRGKLMKAMSRRELYARIADAYQLAGALLIGARVLEDYEDRNINGWTDDEVALAVETLLNFLSCPAELTKEKFDRANAVYRKRSGVPEPVLYRPLPIHAHGAYSCDDPACKEKYKAKKAYEKAKPWLDPAIEKYRKEKGEEPVT